MASTFIEKNKKRWKKTGKKKQEAAIQCCMFFCSWNFVYPTPFQPLSLFWSPSTWWWHIWRSFCKGKPNFILPHEAAALLCGDCWSDHLVYYYSSTCSCRATVHLKRCTGQKPDSALGPAYTEEVHGFTTNYLLLKTSNKHNKWFGQTGRLLGKWIIIYIWQIAAAMITNETLNCWPGFPFRGIWTLQRRVVDLAHTCSIVALSATSINHANNNPAFAFTAAATCGADNPHLYL